MFKHLCLILLWCLGSISYPRQPQRAPQVTPAGEREGWSRPWFSAKPPPGAREIPESGETKGGAGQHTQTEAAVPAGAAAVAARM